MWKEGGKGMLRKGKEKEEKQRERESYRESC